MICNFRSYIARTTTAAAEIQELMKRIELLQKEKHVLMDENADLAEAKHRKSDDIACLTMTMLFVDVQKTNVNKEYIYYEHKGIQADFDEFITMSELPYDQE